MNKKIILVLVGIFFFFEYGFVLANISINEVMYSSSGGNGEWIEIFNSGDSSVNLTDWRFFNNNTDSSPIRLQKGSEILEAGAYAIITNISNIEFISGTVFSSSLFSLPDDSSKYNTYKAISDSNKQIIDFITYDTSIGGGKDSGNSLSKVNNIWVAVAPTPNTKNYSSGSSPTTSTTPSITEYSSPIVQVIETKIKTTEAPKIKTEIISKKIAFVGIPFLFKGNSLGYSGEILRYGKYFWNFGDGDSKEQINNFDKFFHTYSYPGEYTISLEYYSNYYGEVPETVSKINIEVLPLSVFISEVGSEQDFFIELSNKSNSEIDISKWILSSDNKMFILPKNTNLLSNSKLILSPKITNFIKSDEKNLKLLSFNNEIVFDYGKTLADNEILPSNTIENSPISKQIKKYVAIEKETIVENAIETEEDNIKDFSNNISANVIESNINKEKRPYLFFGLFVVLLSISSISVYFIRQKRIISKEGDDFEILDE